MTMPTQTNAPSPTPATPATPTQLHRELAQAAQEARLLDTVLAAVMAASDQPALMRLVGFGIKELLPYERWSRVTLALCAQPGQLQLYQLIGERNNPFWDNVGKGIQAAADDLGVQASFAMATMASAITQEKLIDQAIAERVDGIALAPADAEALEPAIRRARAAGIPLVTFCTPPAAGSAALLDIGTDNLQAGRLAGQALARLLPPGSQVGVSVYSLAQVNMRQRVDGLHAAIAGTGITALEPFAIHDDRALGLRRAREAFAAHPGLAGALGAASLNAPVWAQAHAEAARAGDFPVVGFDLVPATIALLKEGGIAATVVQREYDMGYRSIELLCQMATAGVEATLARQPASRFVDTGLDLVTLARTPWSVALADYLRRPRQALASPATAAIAARPGRPIRLLAIGILPQADPDIASREDALRPGSLIDRVLASGQSQVEVCEPADAARPIRTRVGVPLRTRQQTLGALTLESPAANACTPEELAMLERITSAVVVALENTRLFRQALERQRELEEAAQRQQLLIQTILDLSNPIAAIVPGILVMPLVGLIDAQRANGFIDTLLSAISARQAQVVLVDITGVPFVDTNVANTIVQAAQAARMLGAEMVLVGITPPVAQTIVHLGISLGDLTTRADLESGFGYALARMRGKIVYSAGAP